MGSLDCLCNALTTRNAMQEKLSLITPEMVNFETDLGNLDITKQRHFRGYEYVKNPLHSAEFFELDLTITSPTHIVH